MSLSVVMITRNEASNVERALRSVAFADELIVLDTESEDDTVARAQRCGANVTVKPFAGFGPTKQAALELATSDWVLSLDADEEVPRELATEIAAATTRSDVDGFELPRLTLFLGRWIRHGGWYPDYVLRLFRRDRGQFTSHSVHESITVTGSIDRLSVPLRHYSYPTMHSYVSKFIQYTEIAGRTAAEQGRRGSLYDLTARPVAKFIKQYLLKSGWRDGREGLLLAFLSAGYVFAKYARARAVYYQLSRRAPA